MRLLHWGLEKSNWQRIFHNPDYWAFKERKAPFLSAVLIEKRAGIIDHCKYFHSIQFLFSFAWWEKKLKSAYFYNRDRLNITSQIIERTASGYVLSFLQCKMCCALLHPQRKIITDANILRGIGNILVIESAFTHGVISRDNYSKFYSLSSWYAHI